MSSNLISSLIGPIGEVVDQLFTSDEERKKLELEKAKVEKDYEVRMLEAEDALALAQAKTNQQEAAHPSIFVAGWRPMIGWISALALFYQFLFYPLAAGFLPLAKIPADDLMPLIFGILGLGSLRTLEKIKNSATKKVRIQS